MKTKFPVQTYRIEKSFKLPSEIIVGELKTCYLIKRSDIDKVETNISKVRKFDIENLIYNNRDKLKIEIQKESIPIIEEVVKFFQSKGIKYSDYSILSSSWNIKSKKELIKRVVILSYLKTNDSRIGYLIKYGKEKGTELFLKFKSGRMKGDKNPGFQHGGRLSPFSDKSEVHSKEQRLLAKEKTKETKKDPARRGNNTKEFWMKKGFSEEDAINKVSEKQSTFSLEKCILKHGEEDGKRIWQERQDKWQESLNSKSQEEKDEINRKKNIFLKIKDIEPEEFLKECLTIKINAYKRRKNINFEDLEQKHKSVETLKQNFINEYLRVFRFIFTPKEYYNSRSFIFRNIVNEDICDEIKEFESISKIFKNGRYTYLSVEEGILRSSYEIYFYSQLKAKGIRFELDKKYPNSKMRFDFFLTDLNIFIEIAGNMGDEKYRNKMKFKEENYGAKIIIPNEMDNFLKKLKN